ncbi:MAG TPA: branched-chain amino acid aminotransferase [Cryomorphaceae bacterium]|nr:branched-chain amino acid aminotransferase [Cryomorphaceae bacterium]
MIDTQTIKIQKTSKSKLDTTDFKNLKFGQTFSDHMFVMDYADGKWQQPEIMPFQNMTMSPASLVIHYGQSIFEGLKAFKNEEGRFGLFRPEMNIKRMNKSAVRMCMPEIPENIFMEGLQELVRLDREWIPDGELSSLYLRPVLFAIDDYIGVKASQSYRFMILAAPVNAYYAKPVRVKIEREFTRAAKGGTGYAKTAGNYAGSLYPAKLANDQGYDQLLWTDAKEHAYIEESGTMNVMFVIDGKLITPELGETILDGVTRRSVLQLSKDWGVEVEERRVSVAELQEAMQNDTLEEAFGCGTAATIAHIEAIADGEKVYQLPKIEDRKLSNRLMTYFVDLKKFRTDDPHGWMIELS